MTGGGDRRNGDRRSAQRRGADPRKTDGGASRAVVVAGERVEHDPAEDAARSAPRSLDQAPAAGFVAQLIGQSGQKRGLKGVPPVLGAARSTYLGAEYSGEKDRRPTAGRTKTTDV